MSTGNNLNMSRRESQILTLPVVNQDRPYNLNCLFLSHVGQLDLKVVLLFIKIILNTINPV